MIELQDLLAASGGRLCGPVRAAHFESFCFDSRLVRPGQLFMAVKTERADGHDHIVQACLGGATGVLCERPPRPGEPDVTWVVATDVARATQSWARYVLAQQRPQIVGITGSVGKTTAKEAIAAVLSARHTVFKNRANYNGLYGLPIVLGELQAGQRIAVLEMAADHFGEMARLCEIAPPEIAVVTGVEPAHLETFGTLDAIAREKGELVEALPAGGLAILNADDARVLAMSSRTAARIVTFGAGPGPRGADVHAADIQVTREGLCFRAETPAGQCAVRLRLLGRHQVYAALAAIAAGLAFQVPLEHIVARLAEMPPIPGRLNPLQGRLGSLLLDDTYGASPAAVEAALDALAALEGRRKIAVLGDMLELGDFEIAGHEQVGRHAARVVDLLVTKGVHARRIAESARAAGLRAEQAVVTYTCEDAAKAVLAQLGPGDLVLLKGSLATRMEQVTRALLDEPSSADRSLVRQDAAWQQIVSIRPDRPTWLEIDLGAIAHNVRRLKEVAGPAALLVSLKADAYGHGAIQVAQTALLNGAAWFGVACLSEGQALREAGIDAPVLILGYTPAWQARDALRHNLTATVFDLDVARALSNAAGALDRPARVHVKVDTGMARLGVFPQDAVDFVRALRALPGLVVEGIFTHLAVADGTGEFEEGYTEAQLAAFDSVLRELERAGMAVPLAHAANSAGLFHARPHAGNLVRSGIAVYGLDPSPQVRCPPDFRPALAWKTQIAQVKELPPGSCVGYGATYRTAGRERIAVIPVGYADGFRRAPQHWQEVLVRGRRAPIAGRVSMDQTMINVTGIPDARQGDEVVLIGSQGAERISAEEVATSLGTINYEVVSGILARVPRTTVAR